MPHTMGNNNEIPSNLWKDQPVTESPNHPTPGEILSSEFLEPLNITQYRLAKDTGLSHATVTQLIKGRRPITLETALRLSRYFGNSPDFWLNLQRAYELRSNTDLKDKIDKEIQPLAH